MNFVALCAVSVGQASDQCWALVCVCRGCSRLIAPVIYSILPAAICTHIFKRNMFSVDMPEKR